MAASAAAAGTVAEVTLGDFQVALSKVRPSVLRDSENAELVPHRSEVGEQTAAFTQLGGLGQVIGELRTSVLLPFTRPELFARLRITPPSGILIAGPPGTGKTQLALALASAASFNVVVLDPGQIRSRVVGESEAALARVFRQAREASPCFLLIDQLELICQYFSFFFFFFWKSTQKTKNKKHTTKQSSSLEKGFTAVVFIWGFVIWGELCGPADGAAAD